MRADQWLVEQGLAPSRARARQWIEAGRVRQRVAGAWKPVRKCSQRLMNDCIIEIDADPADRYVSRGGLKLAGALQYTGVDVRGLTVLDIGASTGGFSDCLLQAGVAKVVAVDVGHGQLDPSLHGDSRLVSYEGINARDLPVELLQHASNGFSLTVMDVSFISQTLILPALIPLMAAGAHLISLVKPQFEVGRQGLGKGGIVRDSALYPEVEAKLREVCGNLGLEVLGYFDSPIMGGDGNREFFIWAQKND